MTELGLISIIILFAAIIVLFLLRAKNVIDVIVLNAVFSVLTVMMYLVLDAPDVGMTEAVVGVITSVFAILTIRVLYNKDSLRDLRSSAPLALSSKMTRGVDSYNFEESFQLLIFLGLLFCAGIFIYAAQDLPQFGYANFDQYYLTNTGKDIGIASTVTAILADYRAYDTLLETMVIFIGGISILFVSEGSLNYKAESQDQLIGVMTKCILPIIILFSLYIQMHGEVSPGGGFQAGAMFGLSLILYSLGYDNKFFSVEKLKNYAVIGISIYLFTGLICVLLDTEFLNYKLLLENKLFAQQLGIILVELGVGITVSAIMLLIYFCLDHADELPN